MADSSLENNRVRGPRAKSSTLGAISSWFKDGQNQLLCILALLALLLYLCVIPYGKMPIYDEQYYVPEARSIIHVGNITNPEHPSLGKLFIASGILTFGDNPWGWRIPSVLFEVASLVIFYFICRRLAGKLTALLASIILLFESLTFVISGLAMLDIFTLTFMLLAFLLYLHNKYVFSGATLALSVLCKMTGLLGVFVILGHWFVTRRKQSPRGIVFLLLPAFVTFMVLMPLLDFAAAREWLNPFERLWHMVLSSKGLTFANLTPEGLAQAAYPWAWILSPRGGHFVPLPAYSFVISPTVWILIIPAMGYMLYEFVKKKTEVSLFVLLWFVATYVLWIPLVILTDRQTYLFYFYPTVPTVCLAIGFAMKRLWDTMSKRRWAQYRPFIQVAVIGYIILHVLLFLVFSPLLAAIAPQVPPT